MKEARRAHAAAHHKDLGFLITGGEDGGYKSSTEITKDGVTFEDFDPLPYSVTKHCAVALDGPNGDFFVAGGWSSSAPDEKRAFVYKGSNWVQMSSMAIGRNGKKTNLGRQNEIGRPALQV